VYQHAAHCQSATQLAAAQPSSTYCHANLCFTACVLAVLQVTDGDDAAVEQRCGQCRLPPPVHAHCCTAQTACYHNAEQSDSSHCSASDCSMRTALVQLEAIESTTAVFCTTATDAAMLSSQHACTPSHSTQHASTRVCIRSNGECARTLCFCDATIELLNY
jgi:hypothetical protein